MGTEGPVVLGFLVTAPAASDIQPRDKVILQPAESSHYLPVQVNLRLGGVGVHQAPLDSFPAPHTSFPIRAHYSIACPKGIDM